LLSNATRFVTVMPSFFMITAASLVIVVLAFNLVGDALRDALDPRSDRS
jgi:ABC-type dipeptide/oligopeptide/nickel transport system permease subunit